MIYIPDLLWAIYQAYSEPLFVSLDSCSHDIYTRPRLTLNHSLSLCPCAISLLLFQDHSPFPFPFPCALDHSATLLLCQAAGLLLSWSAYTHDKPPACPCVIALLCNLSFAVPGITLIISHSLAVLLCQGLPGSLSVPFPCALDHSATLLRQGLPGSLSFPFPCVIYLLLCQAHSHSHFHSHVQSFFLRRQALIISHSLAVPGTVYLILIYYDWFSMRLLMSGKPCSQLATSTSWGTDAYIQCS